MRGHTFSGTFSTFCKMQLKFINYYTGSLNDELQNVYLKENRGIENSGS